MSVDKPTKNLPDKDPGPGATATSPECAARERPQDAQPADGRTDAAPLHPAATPIYLLFFLSGISGLIYETVWLRVLIRILGCTVYATAVVLAAFMAGLALGSFVIGRWASRTRDLLRLYALLELGIALSALTLSWTFPLLVPVYRFLYGLVEGSRPWVTLLQASLLFALLLVPTFLMGGTLPVLSAHTRRYGERFVLRLGCLYGMNTLGAVLGVLASGLVLLGEIGEFRTVLAGAVLNLAVFGLAYALARRESSHPDRRFLPAGDAVAEEPALAISSYSDSARRRVLAVYAASGFVAMAYEIVWSRMCQIYAGTSIYAFSLMLAFYLAGLAAGSMLGSRFFSSRNQPLLWFGLGQIGIACCTAAGMGVFVCFNASSVYGAQAVYGVRHIAVMVLVPLLLVTPVTLIMGFLLPAASRSYVRSESEVSHAVGRLYALNTAGCILGSLVCGFVLVEAFGTKGTLVLLVTMNVLLGVCILSLAEAAPGGRRTPLALSALVGAIAILASALWPDPFLNALMKKIRQYAGLPDTHTVTVFCHKESAVATTTAFAIGDDPTSKLLWFNGVGMMTRLRIETKLMAHIPLLLHPHPENIAVICLGTGTTVRSALKHPGLRHCDVVELVPETYDCMKFFHQDAATVLADPRLSCFVDDGRNFLLMRTGTYDVITVDPSPPVHGAGNVNLYSREFIQLCRDHLNPGGIMCLWVPPWWGSEARLIMSTFQSVFPNTQAWGGPVIPGVYLLGLNGATPLDLHRFQSPDGQEAILADLNEWNNCPSLMNVTGLALMNAAELATFLQGTPIITDDLPLTEFPIWRSIYDPTYRQLLSAVDLAKYKDKELTAAQSPSRGPTSAPPANSR